MERQLATIQTIQAIELIPNAEAIEKVRVLGWNVVVKKGEFQLGQKVIYCEIDSFLPIRPEFEFLRANCFKAAQFDVLGNVALRAGFRIKTIKLRGQVSQGICFTTKLLAGADDLPVGTEVTKELEILKWEDPIPPGMIGRVKGPFPSFLPKTDETRVQLLADTLERQRGKQFQITEKLDGSSFSAFIWQDQFGICSRNLWLDEHDGTSQLIRVARALDLETKLRSARERLGFDLAIQGELIGPSIQANKYRLQHPELRVFNLLNLSERKLVPFEMQQKEITVLGLTSVPMLGTIILNHTIDELIELSQGKSTLLSSLEREGIVLRPAVEEYDETIGGRLSFKAINPAFLLKYDV